MELLEINMDNITFSIPLGLHIKRSFKAKLWAFLGNFGLYKEVLQSHRIS